MPCFFIAFVGFEILIKMLIFQPKIRARLQKVGFGFWPVSFKVDLKNRDVFSPKHGPHSQLSEYVRGFNVANMVKELGNKRVISRPRISHSWVRFQESFSQTCLKFCNFLAQNMACIHSFQNICLVYFQHFLSRKSCGRIC